VTQLGPEKEALCGDGLYVFICSFVSGLIVMHWSIVNKTQILLYNLIAAISHVYKTCIWTLVYEGSLLYIK